MFLSTPSKAAVAPVVRDIRQQAAGFGRDPHDIAFFTLTTLIPDRVRAKAEAKLAEYRSYVDAEGALALFSGWTGIDFSRFALDAPLPREAPENAVQSMSENFTSADPGRVWTLREVLTHNGIGGRGPVLVGTPGDIADALQGWMEETDIDGFNLGYAVTPESFVDMVELVVPELQRRGLYRATPPEGTLRARFQSSDRLRSSHPGAAYPR